MCEQRGAEGRQAFDRFVQKPVCPGGKRPHAALFGARGAQDYRRSRAGEDQIADQPFAFAIGQTKIDDHHIGAIDAQMRALETGRMMLRATNTGMTAVIAADGRVDKFNKKLAKAEAAKAEKK